MNAEKHAFPMPDEFGNGPAGLTKREWYAGQALAGILTGIISGNGVGIIVEIINPEFCRGVQHCWITDARPDSPTRYQILAHATGDTLAQAVESATDAFAAKLAALPS